MTATHDPAPGAAASTSGAAVDPITFEVIKHRLLQINDEQGKTYSSKITSFGVVDSTEITDGEVTLFVGPVGFTIDKVLKVTKPTPTDSSDT